MAGADPFADAGFVPVPSGAPSPQGTDPFGAAGFVPVPPSPVAAQPVAPPSSFLDRAGQFLATAGADAVGGMVGPFGQALGPKSPARQRFDALLGAAGAPQPTSAQAAATPDASTVSNALMSGAGIQRYQPQGLAGRVGLGATTGAMMGLTSPSSLLAATLGGAGSEFAGQFAPRDRVSQFWARLLGGVPGGLVGSGISKAIRPTGGLPIEDAQLARKATSGPIAGPNGERVPIPLGTGQVSTDPFIRKMEAIGDKMPLTGSAYPAGQQEALNRNLALTMGEDAPRITQDYLGKRRGAIGQGFNDIISRNDVLPAQIPPFVQRLHQIANDARLNLGNDDFGIIDRNINNVLSAVDPNTNTMTGSAYQSLTRYDASLSSIQRSKASTARFAGQIRDALDDAWQASMQNPADAARFQQLRSQWRAMMIIEPLTLRGDTVGGVSPSVGDISAAALRERINKMYPASGHAPNDLDTLARIGQRFLKEPGTSGTPEGMMALGGLGVGGEALSALGGMLLGHGYEPGLGAITGAGGTWLAARGANAALRSQLLANQFIKAGLAGRQQAQNPLGPPGFLANALTTGANALLPSPVLAPFALAPPVGRPPLR